MEHEIMGHSKKAVKIWKTPGKEFMEKFKEILTEILIIIFAVSFAAFIERTREHYKEKAEAKAFLIGLKSDLDDDIRQIKHSKDDMLQMKKSYSLFKSSMCRTPTAFKRQTSGKAFLSQNSTANH